MSRITTPVQGTSIEASQFEPLNDSFVKGGERVDTKLNKKSKSRVEKRMTIALPSDSARMLELLCELQGITQVEALRRAISTEAFIQREIQNGSRILAQSPDRQIKELVFR